MLSQHTSTSCRSPWTRRRMMFIAMNRFRVKKGFEEAFEQVWLSRDTQLTKVPGFVEFHLLKGPEHEDYTLYSSHSVWQNKATFEAWTKSEAFRLAHRDAGQNKPLYLDHPQFEGFEVRQTVRRGEDASRRAVVDPAGSTPRISRACQSGEFFLVR